MKYLLTTTALGLILAVTPAAAQDQKPMGQSTETYQLKDDKGAVQGSAEVTVDKDKATQQGQAQAPATTDMQKSEQAQTPSTTAQPGAQQPATTSADRQPAAAIGELRFVQQMQPGQALASELIGQSVTNANNETIGDINDLLVDKDGNVLAVVIGVGGFLGIGEKDVAIDYRSLQISEDPQDNDNLKVSLNVTRESLDSAPEFVTLDDQAAEQNRAARQAPAGGGNPMAPRSGGAQ